MRKQVLQKIVKIIDSKDLGRYQVNFELLECGHELEVKLSKIHVQVAHRVASKRNCRYCLHNEKVLESYESIGIRF
jgi:hypothetical protein